MPVHGEISPKQQVSKVHTQGEISPNQPQEQGDLEAMEEGAVGGIPEGSVRNEQGLIHRSRVERHGSQNDTNM